MYFYLSKVLTPLVLPVNILIALLLFIFLNKKFKKLSLFFLSIFIFISFVPLGNFLSNIFLNENIYYGKNSNNFDSILILGGSEDRILHGIYLSKLNPDAKIIFSGGLNLIFSNNEKLLKDEKKNFENISKKLIDKNQLVSIPRSRNTFENLKNFTEVNAIYKFKKTIVVTNPWHYKRTFFIAKKLNLDLEPYYWPPKTKYSNFFDYYQNLDTSVNLIQFNRFFKEIYGILAMSII